MKIMDQPDGLEGYVVLVNQGDLQKPLDLPELKGDWVDIINRCEGVVRNDGLFHCVYLTNNEFAIEFLIPETLIHQILRHPLWRVLRGLLRG